MNKPDSLAEQQYDRLDDLGVFDAATIRQMTGYEADGSNKDSIDREVASHSGNIALKGFGTVTGDASNQKGGLDHTAYARHSPRQKEITSRGVALTRNQLRNSRG